MKIRSKQPPHDNHQKSKNILHGLTGKWKELKNNKNFYQVHRTLNCGTENKIYYYFLFCSFSLNKTLVDSL